MPSCEDAELTTDAFYDALLDDNVEDLYENAPCGYLSTTPDGAIIKVNQTLLGWAGLEQDQVVGRKRFPELLTAGGRIFYETHIAPNLRMQGRVREIAVELALPDGQRLPVLVNAVMKRDAEGRPLVVRVAVFDATERRAYEQELLRARQQAEASEARARALAHTLQQSLLPPEPPVIPGLALAGRYHPASGGIEVGGDFYDVFENGDGEWSVVLGDVCGKGVDAAMVTSLARYTTRAAAVQDRSPATALRTLSAAILRQHVDRFCTAVYVRIESLAPLPRLTLASGGHPPPVHLTSVGAQPLPCAGTLLGVFDDVTLDEQTLELDAGEAIVLYTDGVTEARSPAGDFYGDDRLRQVLASMAAAPADDIADALLDDVLAFQGGVARDDIALVVLQHPR